MANTAAHPRNQTAHERMKNSRKPHSQEQTEKSIRLDMAHLNSFADRPGTNRAIEASRIELVAAGGESECTQTFHFQV
jgi:hypothetical protein